MWPVNVGVNVCPTVLFMHTYVIRHMQEGLVNACIDMYESEPTSARTPGCSNKPRLPDLIRHGSSTPYVISVPT